MIGAGLVYVGAFLFVLTIVVFFHELGHFWVARKCGVKVEVFSVGFGKEIFGWYDKKGTRWKLSLLPLGGYVKFLGDDTAASTPDHDRFATMTASDRVQSFHHQSVWRRMAIVAAGPVANFLLAILIFAAIFMFFGRVEMSARVDSIQPG
ncbi:MAG TPA: RIP metalloprotease RseP, partial [Alphaproteobacteria bacterium]|nr:RIP metalloprotease RseP [Alphaproteobacteria bacterium]